MTQISDTPKVFISYSWSSEAHIEWVADLGERLMSDGVDVVLDQWSLKDGQDLNSFMEQMVTDSTIKRVIIICDSQYAKRADKRKGGVGTESQIISQEVYQKVDQDKFIPVLVERDTEGNPCLPVYLKSRKHIDYTDVDREADSYDQLLRNIFDRPKRRKPVLGSPPKHLFTEDVAVIPAAQKAKRFRDVIATGKGNASAAFDDFADEFLINLEDLRIAYSREQKQPWCQSLFENISRSAAYRDIFVDIVRTAIAHVREDWFIPALEKFLERLLPFQFRPKREGSFFECSEDNFKFLIYESFLYTVASFISARRYEDARIIFDHQYVCPDVLSGDRIESHTFSAFNPNASSLEGECADRGNTRRLSVMADLLHDRATRSDIHFRDLLQADVICCIAAFDPRGRFRWYPRSLVYAGRVGTLELFLRAITENGFRPLGILSGTREPRKLIELICSESMMNLWHGRDFLRSVHIEELLNLDELRKTWMK